jgi:hypothetical protein
LKRKYKEEETEEVVSEETIKEKAKQVSLREEDEDETMPIKKLIRK